MNNKLFYYDLETTGFSHHKNAIHQIAAIIEIKGEIKEKLNIYMKPFDGSEIEPAALEVGKVTEQAILNYPSAEEGIEKLLKTLKKYMKKPYSKERLIRVGFCNTRFDDRFLSALFERYGLSLSDYFIIEATKDLHPIAKSHFCRNFISTDDLKLHSTAKALGIEVDKMKLHDASYDVDLTRGIHNIIFQNETNKNKSKPNRSRKAGR